MNIRVRTVWNGRNGQKCTCFQPPPAVMKDRRLLMTFQPIMGSDYYGPVMESVSGDGGETWSDPVPVPGFGPVPLPGGIQESICDVVPECHPELGTVLAIGHNVYYRQGKLYDTLGDWNSAPDTRFVRRSYYAVRNDRGEWTVRRRPLDFPCFDKDTSCCTCGCSQRYFDGNKLYIPFSFGTVGRRDRMFRSVLAEFDGTSVRYLETGNVLELPAGRGLLEPSLCRHHGVFYVTLRTEDGFAHWSESMDGLHWNPLQFWHFDDGTPLETASTQQHFLIHNGVLHLVYTRRTAENADVMRFRAPLFIARVNERFQIVRSSEMVVFPEIREPEGVALMGNFHTLSGNGKSYVAVGETRFFDRYRGDTLLAEIE